jgi:beta-lactam-binding protein with PASTA domain
MPRTEDQIQELIGEMYTTADSAHWDLDPEAIRAQPGRRGVSLPDLKVLILVAAAVILVVVGIVVTHGPTAQRTTAGASPSTTTAANPQTVAPDLIGLSQEAAANALGRAGLDLGNVTLAPSGHYAAGAVVGQTPAAGSAMRSGGSVHVVISTGPPGTSGATPPAPTTSTTVEGTGSVVVPSLIGLSQAQAGSTLGAAGLDVGQLSSVPSQSLGAGLVVSESPVAGSLVLPGSSVDVVVSNGP